MPDVEEGTTYGTPALKVKGRMFACIPNHKSAEAGSLAVCIAFTDRDALLAAEPKTYYVKEHYVNYPCVLVRLAHIHRDALKDLLLMAWRFESAKTGKRRPAQRKRSPR